MTPDEIREKYDKLFKKHMKLMPKKEKLDNQIFQLEQNMHVLKDLLKK
jgi:hypothetical protein